MMRRLINGCIDIVRARLALRPRNHDIGDNILGAYVQGVCDGRDLTLDQAEHGAEMAASWSLGRSEGLRVAAALVRERGDANVADELDKLAGW